MGYIHECYTSSAVHLGRDHVENLRFTKNQVLKSAKQLFQVTEKLIMDQTEIGGMTTIDYKEPTWRWTALLCDKAIEITNAKTFVFGDSVLCLRNISDQPVEPWMNKIRWYLENRYLNELNRIDGEPMDALHWASSKRFKKVMIEFTVWTWAVRRKDHLPSQCTTTFCEENEETQKNVRRILLQLRTMRADSRSNVGHFLGPGSEKRNGTGLILINPMENKTKLLNEWCLILQKAVTPSFVPPVPWKEEN